MDATNLDVAADSGPIDLKAIYQQNLGYDINRSSVEAGRFVKACRAILALPVDTNNAVEGVRFNRELIADQLNDARKWLNSSSAANGRRPRTFIPDTRMCK